MGHFRLLSVNGYGEEKRLSLFVHVSVCLCREFECGCLWEYVPVWMGECPFLYVSVCVCVCECGCAGCE